MKNIETINDYLSKLDEEANETNFVREKATYLRDALLWINNEFDWLSTNEKDILTKLIMNNETLINYKEGVFKIYDDTINHKQMMELGVDINDYCNLLIKLTKKRILMNHKIEAEYIIEIKDYSDNSIMKEIKNIINFFKN